MCQWAESDLVLEDAVAALFGQDRVNSTITREKERDK